MNHASVSRLASDLGWLEEFTDPARPYTRRAFTELFLAARQRLGREMEAAGLQVTVDAAGNLVGRREGRRRDLPPLMVGSHSDTVVDGGRFDGIIGVLGGLELARWLSDNALELDHPLEVVDFLSEEPSDYGVSTVGSRGMVGTLDAEMLSRRNAAGETLAEGIARMGGDPSRLVAPLRSPGDAAGYLELHIEQGPVLEANNLPVGVVTGIVGVRRWELAVSGRPDHAGTAPMGMRRDALCAASELVLAVERLATGEADSVGTVGRLLLEPNAPNVVPGLVTLLPEARSLSTEALDRMETGLQTEVFRVSAERRIVVQMSPVSQSHPVVVPDDYLAAQEAVLQEMGLKPIRVVSGAGHDGNQMSRICPVGMFFVRCLAGRSHCPEEWTEPEDIALGVEALGRTLLRLDKRL